MDRWVRSTRPHAGGANDEEDPGVGFDEAEDDGDGSGEVVPEEEAEPETDAPPAEETPPADEADEEPDDAGQVVEDTPVARYDPAVHDNFGEWVSSVPGGPGKGEIVSEAAHERNEARHADQGDETPEAEAEAESGHGNGHGNGHGHKGDEG